MQVPAEGPESGPAAPRYFTRSRAVSEYKAAGVLPFAISCNQLVVLLGAELERTGPKGKYRKYLWRDFGGQREAVDADSAATAARECAEETLGLLGSCGVDAGAVSSAAAGMARALRDGSCAVRVVHRLRRGAYHMYVAQVPFITALMFRLATVQNAATAAVAGAEKTAFAWVPLSELLRAVAGAAPAYTLACRSAVCGGRGTPPRDQGGLRRFPLHPCFAASLRLAWEQGGLQALPLRHMGAGEPASWDLGPGDPGSRVQKADAASFPPRPITSGPTAASHASPPRDQCSSLVHCLAQAEVAAVLEPLPTPEHAVVVRRSLHGQSLGSMVGVIHGLPRQARKRSRKQRLRQRRRRQGAVGLCKAPAQKAKQKVSR